MMVSSEPGVAAETTVDGPTHVVAAIDALVDEYRTRCLWSWRSDYYPRGNDERLRVLEVIQRYGDLSAYRRASILRQWLSRISSVGSASS